MFERAEESALLLRMMREAAAILGARWDKVPERHRPHYVCRGAMGIAGAVERRDQTHAPRFPLNPGPKAGILSGQRFRFE